MNKIPFRKYHGFGNDYIVLTNEELGPVRDLARFARAICCRNTGAGSDGIALLQSLKNDDADFSCRIINPDGGEAGFSGNGTRCAAAHLYRTKIWSAKNLRLKTKSGIKNYEFLHLEHAAYWFRAELGHPSFASGEVPFVKSDRESPVSFADDKLKYRDISLPYCVLNVGNPVCAVFVGDFDFNWRALGSAIESHESFPERTNVVFVVVGNESRIEIRIWERGAGETLSSGTCSIAAAVASAKTGRTGRSLMVQSEGGTTEAVWRNDDEMVITGSAQYVYSGEWPIDG